MQDGVAQIQTWTETKLGRQGHAQRTEGFIDVMDGVIVEPEGLQRRHPGPVGELLSHGQSMGISEY